MEAPLMHLRSIVVVSLLLLQSWEGPAQSQNVSIDKLGWIAGCWERTGKGRVTTEQWMKPSGGMMLGMSHTVANGRTVEHEFIQIIQEENGDIYYVAFPSRQEKASFKLVKHGEGEALFENPEHDFPQRIIYRLEKDGSLFARIEGTVNGKQRGVDFPMKRATCD